MTLTVYFKDEEALLSEMEVTGQAFEDMQEQNIRLLQQLREKDDANFKLMSEVAKNFIYCQFPRCSKFMTHDLFAANQIQPNSQAAPRREGSARGTMLDLAGSR